MFCIVTLAVLSHSLRLLKGYTTYTRANFETQRGTSTYTQVFSSQEHQYLPEPVC